MSNINSEKPTLTYSRTKKIMDALSPYDTKKVPICKEVYRPDGTYILTDNRQFLRDILFRLVEKGLLEMEFKMYYTDNHQKIRFHCEKSWVEKIRQLRTVWIRRYEKDFWLVRQHIRGGIFVLCENLLENNKKFNVSVMLGREIYEIALTCLKPWESIKVKADKPTEADYKKVCETFTDEVTNLWNREKFKFTLIVDPYEPDRDFLTEICRVFTDALAELIRRNDRQRVEVEYPEENEVYEKFEVTSENCEWPVELEPSELHEKQTLVRQRLQAFLWEYMLGLTTLDDENPDMPLSWMDQWKKVKGETGYLPLSLYEHYTTKFLRRDSHKKADSEGSYEWEYQPTKIVWRIKQTEDCEERLEQIRIAEENHTVTQPKIADTSKATRGEEVRTEDEHLADTKKAKQWNHLKAAGKKDVIENIRIFLMSRPNATDQDIIDFVNKTGTVRLGKNALTKSELGKVVEESRRRKKKSVYTHSFSDIGFTEDE